MEHAVNAIRKRLAIERKLQEVITMLQAFHITELYSSLDVLPIKACQFYWEHCEEMEVGIRPVDEVTCKDQEVATNTAVKSKMARFASKSTYEPPLKLSRYNDQGFSFIGDISKLEDFNRFMKQRSFQKQNFEQFFFDGNGIPFTIRHSQEVEDATETNSSGSFSTTSTTTQSVEDMRDWNDYNADNHSETVGSEDDNKLCEEYNFDHAPNPMFDENNDFIMILNACRETYWNSPD